MTDSADLSLTDMAARLEAVAQELSRSAAAADAAVDITLPVGRATELATAADLVWEADREACRRLATVTVELAASVRTAAQEYVAADATEGGRQWTL